MRFVYVLQYVYDYEENGECEDVKFLGVFSSKFEAQEAIKNYIKLPGFNKYGIECFNIDKCEIDKLEWKMGFIDASKYEI